MKKWRVFVIITMVFFFVCSTATVVMHGRGYPNVYGADIRQFGFFFLSLSWFLAGFLNLIAFLNGKNKGFNLGMMIMFFSTGLMNIAIGVIKYIVIFGKH